MIRDDERRVHKLRLRAGDEQLIRRGAILVEDALHCASLPASGPGLLCVRRLSLGRFRCNQSSMNLAALIEQQLREHAISAAIPESPEADRATAVRFRDPVEPYLMLIQRLVKQSRVDAWYWSSAVRCWDPHEPPDVALRKILLEVQRLDDSAPAALAHWITRAAGSYFLDSLLEPLQSADGIAMLPCIGLSPPPPEPRLPLTFDAEVSGWRGSTPPIWTKYARAWIERWGEADPRSTWLVAMFMIAENPMRRCAPEWPRNVLTVVATIAHDVNLDRAADASDPDSLPQGRRPRTPRPAKNVQEHQADLHEHRPSTNQPSRVDDQVEPTVDPTRRPMERTTQSVAINRARSSGAKSQVEPNDEFASSQHQDPLERSEDSAHRQTTVDEGATGFAGLFLLVQVLERLGIQAWLENHPEWIELRAPMWILHDIASRMGAAPKGPVMRALEIDTEEPDRDRAADFVVPDHWHTGITESSSCSVHEIEAGFMMLDASKRLPLAFWRQPDEHGLVPKEIRLAFGEGDWQITMGQPGPMNETAPWDLALRSWRYAIRRWCRRILQVGLHDVVSRFGRVLSTDTHIDIFFENRQADARIRRGGLDIDPGWTPWLGKIVYFHYVDGDDESSKSG